MSKNLAALMNLARRRWLTLVLVSSGLIVTSLPELTTRVPSLVRAVQSGAGVTGALIFCIVWVLALLTTFATTLASPLLVRAAYGVLFFGSATLVVGYRLAMNEPLEVAQFERTVMAARSVLDAIAQYSGAVLAAIALAAPLMVALVMRRSQRAGEASASRATGVTASFLPLVASIPIAAICWARGGEGTVGLPAALRPSAYAIAIGADELFGSGARPRIQVDAKATEAGALDNIVLIVDESVVSDVFDTASDVHISGHLGPLASFSYDFGPAASASNCSADANVLLRVGPRQAHVKEDLVTYPTLWDYAKRAGYATIYIDAQEASDVLHNGMSQRERALIDQVFVAGSEPIFSRDRIAGERLAGLLTSGTKNFVLINKVGAHFPWDSKYPATDVVYRPTLGLPGNVASSHAADQPPGLVDSISAFAGGEAYKNSYRNAVEWNFNSFFAALPLGEWLDRSVLVYTSDHGQNVFREGGRTNTHCSSGTSAARAEGRVPLLFITGAKDWKRTLSDAAERNRGRLSHFSLFSSLIRFMGFRDSQVADRRDAPVWANPPPNDALKLATEIQVRFGRPVSWVPLCKVGDRMAANGSCHAPN